MKLFYDHLVVRGEISKTLRKYNLSVEEHIEIVRLADETIHHEVLDVILTSIPAEKHKEFLAKMHASPDDRKLLDEFSDEVHMKIKERGQKIKQQILSEIKRSQRK